MEEDLIYQILSVVGEIPPGRAELGRCRWATGGA